LSLYGSAYGARDHDEFEFPVSSKHKMLETLTVFDDVFVPWERVFVCRQPELAGTVSNAFVEFHRFTAVSYKLPLLDALVGTAALIAEMNGVARAGHIREKVTQLIVYAETVRALTEMAGLRAQMGEHDIAYPDPLTTNLAKFTFATRYHEKFYRAKAPAEERLRLLNTISDLTARDFGGYHAVLAVHAEGSIEAEKMQIYRAYEPGRAIAYAKQLAGLD
jgi:aromatic ring hydroxylase